MEHFTPTERRAAVDADLVTRGQLPMRGYDWIGVMGMRDAASAAERASRGHRGYFHRRAGVGRLLEAAGKEAGMMRVAVIALLVASTTGGPAAAGNAACGGNDEMQHISCTKITEQLVRGLIGASKAKLDATMGVTGIRVSGDTWHFMSNFDYGRTIGSGFINFVIADGVVRAIFGAVGSDNPKLLFDGKTNFKFRVHAGGPECSDAPGWASFSPCPK